MKICNLSHMRRKFPLIVNSDVSSGVRGLNFGLGLSTSIFPYFVYARSVGLEKSVQLRRIVRAIASRQCDKLKNITSWAELKCIK